MDLGSGTESYTNFRNIGGEWATPERMAEEIVDGKNFLKCRNKPLQWSCQKSSSLFRIIFNLNLMLKNRTHLREGGVGKIPIRI